QALQQALQDAMNALRSDNEQAFKDALGKAAEAAKQMAQAMKQGEQNGQNGSSEQNEDMAKTLEQMRANIQAKSRESMFTTHEAYAKLHTEMKEAIEQFSKSPEALEHKRRQARDAARKHELSQQAQHRRRQELL